MREEWVRSARAKEEAFECLVEFVREARAKGWDPEAFVPRVASRLGKAVRLAGLFEDLRVREGKVGAGEYGEGD